MTSTIVAVSSTHLSHSSVSLDEEWKRACYKAMRVPFVPSEQTPLKASNRILLNLTKDETIEKSSTTPWMETALEISRNLIQTREWMYDSDFTSVHLPASDASLVQSTVTSFTATTAGEIKSLQSLIREDSQKGQHCQGIIHILLDNLQELAREFGELQKQRHRPALSLWQDPLACGIYLQKNAMDEALGVEEDLRFYPTQDRMERLKGFWKAHEDHENMIQKAASATRPISRFGKRKRKDQTRPVQEKRSKEDETTSTVRPLSSTPTPTIDRQSQFTNQQGNRFETDNLQFWQENQAETQAALQQEALVLQAKADNDLDAVQAMEQSMVDITTLLAQFANLVSEQQRDVQDIYSNTKDAKENLDQGQEQLIQAKEQTQASSHWMAKTICAMTLLMLFFHAVRP